MSVVISDASPIRALAHLQLLSLLHSLYGEVFIPPGVAEELTNPSSGLPPLDWTKISGLRVEAPTDSQRVTQLRKILDKGESEAIALAIEKSAFLLLIDERTGRAVATSMGLNVLGVLALLIKAKEVRLVSTVQPLLDELRNGLNFYISPALYQQILKSAGE